MRPGHQRLMMTKRRESEKWLKMNVNEDEENNTLNKAIQ